MAAQELSDQPTSVYLLWLRKIVDTHATRAWDEPRSKTQEEEEERLNGLWGELDELDQLRLWGLSADLHSLRDREVAVEADCETATEEEIAQQQKDAWLNGQWDEFLESLRRAVGSVPRAKISFLRGQAWLAMKHPDVALLFFENAARLEPGNPASCRMASHCRRLLGNR